MKRYFFVMSVLLVWLSSSVQAMANGWGEQEPLQFKLSRPGGAETNESLRLAYDRDLGGATGSTGGGGDTQVQDSRNLNNVIEITETYTITLNGNNNTVSTKGLILNGDQDSGSTTQDGTNTTNANSSTRINNARETGSK